MQPNQRTKKIRILCAAILEYKPNIATLDDITAAVAKNTGVTTYRGQIHTALLKLIKNGTIIRTVDVYSLKDAPVNHQADKKQVIA